MTHGVVHLGMVSKSSAVRSIRLQNDIWEWLAAEAERRQTNVNGLVTDLLLVARLKAEEAKAKPVDVKAAHARVQKRYPKTLAALAESEAVATPPKFNIQIGPIERKPGSMLKKGK